jgi:hypothetical protein
VELDSQLYAPELHVWNEFHVWDFGADSGDEFPDVSKSRRRA